MPSLLIACHCRQDLTESPRPQPSGEAHHLAALWGRLDPFIEFHIFGSYDDFRSFVSQNEKSLQKSAKKKVRVISSRTREDNGNAEKLLMYG